MVHVIDIPTGPKRHGIVHIFGALIDLTPMQSIVGSSFMIGFDNILSKFRSNLWNEPHPSGVRVERVGFFTYARRTPTT